MAARRIQRYVVHEALASGGMASIHLGRLEAAGGFSRVVALKLMHAQFATDAEFRAMFLDEARLVARIRHPNVVSTLDILDEGGELALVMDYIHGPTLARVIHKLPEDDHVPLSVGLRIVIDMLEGLHAAHEAQGDGGERLEVVHRDVSPDNVLVGADGIARVADFGIATAADRLQKTRPGEVKGKSAYMPPEQSLGQGVDRRSDVYSAGVVLFEVLTRRRPFWGGTFAEIALKHLTDDAPAPSTFRSAVTPELDAIVVRALAKKREERFATAREMASAIEELGLHGAKDDVARWLAEHQSAFLQERSERLASFGRVSSSDVTPSPSGHAFEIPIDVAMQAKQPAAAPPRRSALPGIAIAVSSALVIAAGGFLLRGTIAPREDARRAAPTAPAEASATASVTTGAAPSAEPPASASVAPSPSAIASQRAPAPKPARPTARPAPRASSSPTPAAPPSHCCVGGVRVKVTDCVDNCPPGT